MHTEIYTLFTRANGLTELLYSAETWVRVRLELETAGPVSVSTRENLAPVLSGRGVLLTTAEEQIWVLPKGDRLFWIAESINRVKFSVEPIAYGDTTISLIAQVRDKTVGVINAVSRLAVRRTPQTEPKKALCPPALRPPNIGGKY